MGIKPECWQNLFPIASTVTMIKRLVYFSNKQTLKS